VTSPAVFSGFTRHIWWETPGVSGLSCLRISLIKFRGRESISYKIKDIFEISIKYLRAFIVYVLARTCTDLFGISLLIFVLLQVTIYAFPINVVRHCHHWKFSRNHLRPSLVRTSSIIGRHSVLSRALNNLRRVTTSASHFPHVSRILSQGGSIIFLTYSQILPIRSPPLISVTCSKGTLQAASSRTLAIFLARSERYNTIITRMFEESARRRRKRRTPVKITRDRGHISRRLLLFLPFAGIRAMWCASPFYVRRESSLSVIMRILRATERLCTCVSHSG